MTPSEEYYLKIRNKLDDLGYLQPLSFESVLLVDKLLEDLLDTKKNLQHYKNVAHQSMEACSELQAGVGPYKEDNAKLIRENNDLRQKLLKARETTEDVRVGSAHKQKGIAREDKELMLEKAQDTINNLTREITKIKSEQQELDEVIECLKNKVNARDSEIERLTSLLADGRPLMDRNQCPCCSPQLLDCRLIAKNKQLSEQLEESKHKQHEAMVRAMELAERNLLLEEKRLPSARSDSSKKCCCAENSNKICKLQEKLEERILQVESLELEISELKKANAEMTTEKKSLDKILEITIEDKKRMNDRINELTIIEHDLMLEIERLKRTNALQKSQLAELEARFTDSEQPTEESVRPSVRPPLTKASSGPSASQRATDSRKPVQVKKVTIRPTPAPAKVTKPAARKPPLRPTRPSETTDSSTLSSGDPVQAPSTQRPHSPSWKEMLLKERKQFEEQLEEMARQQAEHCAKYHPPPCPRSARRDNQPLRESDPQWLLLERVQAERDYYYKEFSRLRDQLCNIPDHSHQASSDPPSPHQKLERLLSERDYYHKEMCRLLDSAAKTKQADKSAVSDTRPPCCVQNNCHCMP